MRKMSAFLELPGEPAFREVQVILTGKRRAVIENYRNIQSYTREEILVLTLLRQTCDPWETPCDPLLHTP